MKGEYVEILFDDFSVDEQEKFNGETLAWLANLLKGKQIVVPVREKGKLNDWNDIKAKWVDELKQQNVQKPVLKAIFRNIKTASNHDIMIAKDMLVSTPAEATVSVFSILNERNTPKKYQMVDEYQGNLRNIMKNHGKITIIDSYLLETTKAIMKIIVNPDIGTKEMEQSCSNRVNQIKLLLQSFFSTQAPIKGLKILELNSVMTDHKKWKEGISNYTHEKPELESLFHDEEKVSYAHEKVARHILKKLGSEVPGLKEQKVTIIIKDLKMAIKDKEIKHPHDRMLIVNHRPEWCATAGFALDRHKDKTLSPQGFFVKFWNEEAFAISDQASHIAEKKYR